MAVTPSSGFIHIPPGITVYSESSNTITTISASSAAGTFEFGFHPSQPVNLYLSRVVSNTLPTNQLLSFPTTPLDQVAQVTIPPSALSSYSIYLENTKDGPTPRALRLGDTVTVLPAATLTVFLPVARPLEGAVEVTKLYDLFTTPVLVPAPAAVTESSSSTTTPTSATSRSSNASTSEPHRTASTSTTPQETGSVNYVPLNAGSLSGIIIAVLLASFAAGLLACFLFVRHRNRRAQNRELLVSQKSIEFDKYPSSGAVARKETPHNNLGGFTGWQKHLPQEKDDTTIQQAVRSMLDKCQIFVEGFYTPKEPLRAEAMSHSIFQDDNLSEFFPKTQDSLSILEAALVRWIVHRISLRGPATESLLPSQYVEIPEKNNWHMELDNASKEPAISEKGHAEAFAEWRVLTSFLTEKRLATDSVYAQTLTSKVEQASRYIDEAFAPWQISQASKTNRRRSMEEMLRQASEVGRLLFTQRAGFVFDWRFKEAGAGFVITPALRRVEAQGGGDKVLVEKRWKGL